MGCCVTLRNKLSEETHLLTEQETIGKGRLAREQQGKGTQENCFCHVTQCFRFYVMGLPSGLSLANQSDAGSFLVHTHALFSQDGRQQGGFWEVVGLMGWSPLSPLEFSSNSSGWW